MLEQASTAPRGTMPGIGRTGPRSRVPAVAAGALTVVAVLCACAAVGLVFYGGVQPVRRLVNILVVPAPPNLAYAAFVVVLAAALSRRKAVAHRVVVLLFAVQLLGDVAAMVVLYGGDWRLPAAMAGELHVTWYLPWSLGINIVISIVVLVVLLWASPEFYGRAQHGSVPRALGVFVLAVLVSIGLGYGLVKLAPGSLVDEGSALTWTVERVLGGAVTFDIIRLGHAPGWVNFVLGAFGSAALFSALAVLFRSQRVASWLSGDDEQRIRRLLAEHGERDSLGYFATRRDKAVLFSASGKAAITYRVVGGVCLASGDPLGDPEAWRPAIERWLAMCREYTWTPAVMGAGETGAAAYTRAGLKALQLGDEAILYTQEFTLEGRDMRPVRQAAHRVSRSGHTTRVRRHREIPAEEMDDVRRLAHQWRDTDTERGFSMALGRLGDPADGDCVLVEALDAAGRVVGLLSFTPWGRRGLSLDVMRRDREADNGLVEFMVTALMQSAARLGVDRVSLNFAMFRAAFEEGARLGAGPVLRAWRRLLVFFSRWWQLESLYRSNVKYRPHWVPRFAVYSDRRDMARVGVASAAAEGFLSVPGRGARRRGAHAAHSDEAQQAVVAVSGAGPPQSNPRVPEQVRVRLAKVDRLRASGIDPYPAGVARSESCRSVRDRHGELAPDTRIGEHTAVAGRVVLMREHGGVSFATLRDWSGDLQIMLTAGETGEDVLRSWNTEVDLGDQVVVRGEVGTSRHGELSVLANDWSLAAKCLRPLPDKHHGLTDAESRVRQRYLDLALRSEARDALQSRSAAVRALRETLIGRDFLEVETPVLQPVHGGANARPFTTHINAYDMRLYLRIAPELYLKRLCVGGVERLFEIGRTFRNEGVSARHNPEFTMLEAYQAFGDYTTARELCQNLVRNAAIAVHGSPIAYHHRPDGQVEELDLGGDWPVRPVHEAVAEALEKPIGVDTPTDRLRVLAERAGVSCDPEWSRGAVVLELYERLVEARTRTPTFYTDFPTDVSPLTRQHREDSRLAERWDLVAAGTELGTGYSELTDPVEQRRRLTAQSWSAAGGDLEAMEVDEDFLAALEYGMPPTGGLGLGVDRLVMLLTGRSIRETLPFPLVKPTRSGGFVG